MSIEDKNKWDKKYAEQGTLLEVRDASAVLQKYWQACEGKKALELACGTGRNSIFLAGQGFSVDAVDIAKQALETLKIHAKDRTVSENITTQLCDLDNFSASDETYDLIVMTNFLDRDLMERTKRALKTGGIFFVETYMLHERNEKEGFNPDFMLQAGELKQLFDEGFEVVFYDEFENESFESYRMQKQAIVVKKLG
jgi:tellurite methyltransferase